MIRTSRAHAHGVTAALAAALLLAACGGEPSSPAGATRTRGALSSGASCPATSTHAKHINMFACETCHPKGGEFGFSGNLPGGTAIAGTIAFQDGVPSCAVSCHAPDGGGGQPVSWGAGAMTCGSCHSGRSLAAAGSAHAPTAERASCAGCHELADHMAGTVRLVDGMQPGAEATCLRCHSGAGPTLAGAAGPLLVGWQDAAGDWHGGRAGTGYGGTLRAPYARGQAPLACAACHDEHASPGAFLFGATVNGVAVPAGAITRAGVGAEALCDACHDGDRHAQCKSCHTAVKVILGDGHVWFDASAPPVDPAPPGYPCFWCHGHEGIVRWTPPGRITDNMMVPWNESCDHCHSFRAPVVETIAPALVGSVAVSEITSTGVTVSWTTSEHSTTQVEYGVGAPGRVAVGAPGVQHAVTLQDLVPGTTYAYRVRSSDAFRNVLRTPVATFRTASESAPLAPALVPTAGRSEPEDWLTFLMRWNPVTAPDGDPVQYRMVLAEDPGFVTLVVDTGWTAATSHTATLSTHSPLGVYWWRVMARDAVHDVRSPWSSTGTFHAWDSRDE